MPRVKGSAMTPGRTRVLSKRLSFGAHTCTFTVEMTPGAGWQVRYEHDAKPTYQKRYDDWHRVEIAISRFAIEAARLTQEGWVEA